MDPLHKLTDISERLDIIRGHAVAVDAVQQDVIREALAAGVPVTGIVKVTGLTRRRVYQIRDSG